MSVVDIPYWVQATLGGAIAVVGVYLLASGRMERLFPAGIREIWERDDRWFISAWRWMSIRGIPLFAMVLWGIALIVD